MATSSMVESACKTLQAAVDVFKEPARNVPVPPDKAHLKQLADKLKTDVAKVHILYGSGAAPSTKEVESVVDTLLQTAIAFCAACHAFTAEAGPTLVTELKKVVTSVMDPCGELVQALATAEPNPDGLRHIVAMVWGSCDAVAKAPADNKSAIFRRLADAMKVLKDSLREMEELEQELQEGSHEGEDDSDEEDEQSTRPAAHANGQATSSKSEKSEGGEEEEEEEDNLLDFVAGPLSAAEGAVLEAVKQLMEVAIRTLKAVSKPLLEGPAVTPSTALEGWENFVFHVKYLQRSVEDLGAATFPPQSRSELDGSSEGVCNTLELILEEVPQEYQSSLQAEVDSLKAQLEAAQERLQASVAELDKQ